jgi:hypothetical protein
MNDFPNLSQCISSTLRACSCEAARAPCRLVLRLRKVSKTLNRHSSKSSLRRVCIVIGPFSPVLFLSTEGTARVKSSQQWSRRCPRRWFRPRPRLARRT